MAAVKITPRMAEAVRYVRANPQCTKRQAAVAIGGALSGAMGIVDRAIVLGLIKAVPVGASYRLTVTPLGDHNVTMARGRDK